MDKHTFHSFGCQQATNPSVYFNTFETMRTIRFVLPALLLLFISCGGDTASTKENTATTTGTNTTTSAPQPGSPEEIGMKISNFVIANDNQGLTDLIIQQGEMEEVIKNSSVSQMGKEVAIKNIPTEISKMRMDYSNGLASIRSNIEATGADWSGCKFKNVTYEINNPTGYNMMQLHCTLDCGGLEQTFTVTDVVETPNGWKLGGTMYFGNVAPQIK